LAAILARSGGDLRMIEAPSEIAARFGHPHSNWEPAGAFSAEVQRGSAQKDATIN
jgi:hypothetical protein